ncbi:MAG: hypothetical protein K6F89_07545 [Prevotella sp.]|nr:hypothetical protein [Prevotella sp.]
MKYKIKRTDHKKLTQGLLRFCMMIPSYYYDAGSREECLTLMGLIKGEFRKTTFLRRNNWEPLESAYVLRHEDERVNIYSNADKLYITFEIVEVEGK